LWPASNFRKEVEQGSCEKTHYSLANTMSFGGDEKAPRPRPLSFAHDSQPPSPSPSPRPLSGAAVHAATPDHRYLGEGSGAKVWHPLWPREKWAVLSSQEICLNMYKYLAEEKVPANEAAIQDAGEDPNALLRMFDSATAPPIALLDYMKRVVHYTRAVCSPVVQVGAVLLIERFERKGHRLTKCNIFRVFAIAYFLSYKACEDEPHLPNSKLSQIAGLPVAEFVALETAFCKSIDFNLGMMHDLDLQQRIVESLLPSSEIMVDDRGTFFRANLVTTRTPSPWSISTPLALPARPPSASGGDRPPVSRSLLQGGSCGTSVESIPFSAAASRETTPAPRTSSSDNAASASVSVFGRSTAESFVTDDEC